MSQSQTEHKVLIKLEADAKGVKAGTDSAVKEIKKIQKSTAANSFKEFDMQKKMKNLQDPIHKFLKHEAPKLARNKARDLKFEHDFHRKIHDIHRKTNKEANSLRIHYQGIGTGLNKMFKGMKNTFKGPGFFKGFSDGMGFKRPGLSRQALGRGAAGAVTGGLGIAGGLIGALMGMVFSAVGSDYQQSASYRGSLGQLAGFTPEGPIRGRLTNSRFEKIKNKAVDYGYMPGEVAGHVAGFMRATGTPTGASYGLGAAKMLSMDPSQIASMFGTIRSGSGTFGEQGLRDFKKVMEAAVKSGVDHSTLPEYFEGIQSLTGSAGGRMGGDVSALPYAQLLAMFEKSGFAGLKGARGASVAASLEGMVTNPGGGTEGRAAVMGAMGFGRIGGAASYYDAKKAMQAGFSGPGGAGVLKKLFDYADHITGGGQESNLYLEGIAGGRLTLDQIETVRKAMGSGASQKDVETMLKDMTATELDVLRSIDGHMRAFLHQNRHSARIANQSVERGAQTADSIESMQDTMQDFLKATLPLVVEALNGVAKVLESFRPILPSMTRYIQSFFAMGTEKSLRAANALENSAYKDARKVLDELDPTNLDMTEEQKNCSTKCSI
ncbi:hypothetical protein HC928_00415 [bacterium]|nr:hypothetical protein [bacterium]